MVDENETIRLLLACGIGASTGFMAANMRKIAKQRDRERGQQVGDYGLCRQD